MQHRAQCRANQETTAEGTRSGEAVKGTLYSAGGLGCLDPPSDRCGTAASSEPLTMSSQPKMASGDGVRPVGGQPTPDRAKQQQPPRNIRPAGPGGQQPPGGVGVSKNSGAPAVNHAPRVQQQGTAPAMSLAPAPATSNGVSQGGGAAGKPLVFSSLNAGAHDFVPGFSSFTTAPPPTSPPNNAPPAMAAPAAPVPAAPVNGGSVPARGWGPVPGKPAAPSGGGSWGAGASAAHAPPQVSQVAFPTSPHTLAPSTLPEIPAIPDSQDPAPCAFPVCC